MFKWGSNEFKQEAIEVYQSSQQLLKTRERMKKEMGENAPRIKPDEFKAYKEFLKEHGYGFYVQPLVLPDETGKSVEVTREEFFALPIFDQIRTEEEKLITAIVFLFSFKETKDHDIWVENDRRIRERYPKPIK